MPRQKNVYVVMTGERHEGGRVLGVYDSYHKAQGRLLSEARELCDNKELQHHEILWEPDGNSFTFSVDWWAIRKYPLQ